MKFGSVHTFLLRNTYDAISITPFGCNMFDGGWIRLNTLHPTQFNISQKQSNTTNMTNLLEIVTNPPPMTVIFGGRGWGVFVTILHGTTRQKKKTS